MPDRPCLVRNGFRKDEIHRIISPWIQTGVPWVIQAAEAEAEYWIAAGAWAVLPPGMSEAVAAGFAAGLQSRISAAREESPLTGLPGNSRIASVLSALIKAGSDSVAYIDIIDFKPFNDYYGFARGDAVIRTLSEILVREARGAFVGHIGGDDFICTGSRQALEKGLDSAREAFRSRVPAFYAEHDRDLGGIETLDRHGRFRFFPFVDICVVILDLRNSVSVEDLAREAGIAKKARKGDLIPGTLSEIIFHDSRGLAAPEPSPEESSRCWRTSPDSLGWMSRMDLGSSDHSDLKAVIEAAGISGDRRVSGLLEDILSGDFPFGLRKSAALSLGSLACPRSLQILRSSLSDPSPHVRTRAVEALALSGDRASSLLIERCTSDSSTWVRRAAYKAAGALRTPAALDLLLERAVKATSSSRSEISEREAALDGLAMLADPAAMDLLAVFVSDPSFEPVEALWKAIASSGADQGAALLCREALENRAAAKAMQWINPSAISESMLGRIEETACALLSTDMRIPALRCLSGLPGPGGRLLVASIDRLSREAEGLEFSLIVTVMEKRGIHPGAAVLKEAAECLESGARVRTVEDIIAMTRLAICEGLRPGALLPLLRSRCREVSLAAARAILLITRTRLSESVGARGDDSGFTWKQNCSNNIPFPVD